MMNFKRTEANGWIIYSRGNNEILKVNPVDDYYKILVKLLEKADGDKNHQIVKDFWDEQADKLFDKGDEMKNRCNQEIFSRLSEAWDKIFSKPEEELDVFAGLET